MKVLEMKLGIRNRNDCNKEKVNGKKRIREKVAQENRSVLKEKDIETDGFLNLRSYLFFQIQKYTLADRNREAQELRCTVLRNDFQGYNKHNFNPEMLTPGPSLLKYNP